MKDQSKTRQVLIQELASLRQRITELEQSESELKRVDDLLRLHSEILANMMEGLHLTRADDGVIVYANQRLESMFGYDPGELVGKHVSIVNSPGEKSPEAIANKITKSLKQAGVWHGEVHNIRKDGTSFWCYANISKFQHPQYGEVCISVHQDITARKKAEEALRESETRYRELFDNISSGVAIYEVTNNGNDFIFKDFNRAGERLDGGRKEDIIGKSIYQVRPGINEYGLLEVFKRVWATGIPEHYPAKFYQDEQLQGWYENFVYRLPSGEIVAVYDDITDRKQTEEALRQSEENFRQSVDSSPMGVRIVTKEGETIYANRAILDIYGYDSIEELRTTPAKKRYTPESHADFLIRRGKREQGIDVPSEYTINIIRKDGEVRCLLVLRREILWDGERQFHVLYNDITERKQAEETLQKRESLLQKIFDVLPVGLWFADKDGKLLRGNPAGVKIWGAEPKVAPAKYGVFKARRLPSGEEIAPEDWALVHTVKEMVTVVDEMLEIDAFDGKKKVILNYTAPVLDDQGAIQGAIVVNLDITERKQAEEELKTSRSQLRALSRRLQQIREEDRIAIAREIHDEMGGGLTGLKMDLSWLSRKIDDTDRGEERIALMDRIHASNVLIDQMIQVVRRVSTHLRPSVLDDLGLIAALEWQLSEFTSRTEIPHEFTPTFEYVNMEEDTAIAVFRIFQEALTNVARHSRATKVAVVLRESERSLFGDESFVLEIRDNGRGITEEEILNPESLGLLGMKERVLSFGGEFSIRAESGGGTALVLQIPRKQGGTL